MTKQELLQRTESYALRVSKVAQALPSNEVGDEILANMVSALKTTRASRSGA